MGMWRQIAPTICIRFINPTHTREKRAILRDFREIPAGGQSSFRPESAVSKVPGTGRTGFSKELNFFWILPLNFAAKAPIIEVIITIVAMVPDTAADP
jgi:hypothetical protein